MPAVCRQASGVVLESPGPGMTLAPGTRLGPYEILAAIGAGGMGEAHGSASRGACPCPGCSGCHRATPTCRPSTALNQSVLAVFDYDKGEVIGLLCGRLTIAHDSLADHMRTAT
jgi:hypothetical protein